MHEINANRSIRTVVETQNMEWESSEADGVLRKRLERLHGNPELVTTVVQFKMGSSFPPHQHVYGEELFVLDGTFSDSHGHYPAGYYLRNPPGSSHAPFSQKGCKIFVKLQQFKADDSQKINIQTNEQQWLPGLVDGLQVMPLHEFHGEHSALVKWEPNTTFQPHMHVGGEEIFVLDGTFEDEFGAYPKGTWLRNPPNSSHTPFTKQGCTIFVKTGHLTN